MRNRTLVGTIGMLVIGASGALVSADQDEPSGAAVARFLPAAKVTLQQGLSAAESQGQPISGKFEVDEGHLQLSVYTARGGNFSEVLVDCNTGKIARSEALTGGEDLADARKQMEAFAKAKKPLKSAVDRAEQHSAGYRAVSVTSKLRNGHAVAVVTLVKGTQAKSLPESLE